MVAEADAMRTRATAVATEGSGGGVEPSAVEAAAAAVQEAAAREAAVAREAAAAREAELEARL
eukprot:118962-Chlamydomonas_euryale.AAC.1